MECDNMAPEKVKKVKAKPLCRVWLSNPMDCSLWGSSIHGIFQARVLEWVAVSFSRGSSRPRGWIWVSSIASRRFYHMSHQRSSLTRPQMTLYKTALQNQNTSCSFIADRYLVFHLHLFVTSLSLLYFEELAANKFLFYFWYLQFSRSVMSDSLRPHELQHARPPCPSQTAHRDGDAIQSSHPLSSPSPPAPNPSQHQGLFQRVNSLHEVAKV